MLPSWVPPRSARGGTEIVLLAVTLIGSFIVRLFTDRAEALNFECKQACCSARNG